MSTELDWPDLRALGHLGPYVRGEDGTPVLAPQGDPRRWMDIDNRRVARTRIGATGAVVSTVLLPVDHNHTGAGPPVLWETVAFSPDPFLMRRYTSETAARDGHREVVRGLRRRRPR